MMRFLCALLTTSLCVTGMLASADAAAAEPRPPVSDDVVDVIDAVEPLPAAETAEPIEPIDPREPMPVSTPEPVAPDLTALVGENNVYLPEAVAAATPGVLEAPASGWRAAQEPELEVTVGAAGIATASDVLGMRVDIVRRTNALRAAKGVAPLTADWRLDAVGQTWSLAQALKMEMSHNPLLRWQAPSGWSKLGENVAFGFRTTEGVMTGWKNSPGHYTNIMDPSFTHIGVGVAYAINGSPYYTQVFGGYVAPVPPPPKDTPVASRPFVDVMPGAPFEREIAWMAESGLSTGAGASGGRAFQPKSAVSREAMAAFLYRVSTPQGAAGPVGFKVPKTSPFADVPTSQKFFKEIAWMNWRGISTGVAQDTGLPNYAPKTAVTREAMAAFLFRLERGKGSKTPARAWFADVKRHHNFFVEVSWMYDSGLSSGVRQPKGLPQYQPKTAVSREAMAAFLYRLKH